MISLSRPTRIRRDPDAGFTSLELLVASAITLVIAAIVLGALLSLFKINQRLDTRANTEAQAMATIQELETNLALSSPVESAGPDQIVMLIHKRYNGRLLCERHQYLLERDTDDPRKGALRHLVQNIELQDGTNCRNLTPTVWTDRNLDIQTDRIAVDNLTLLPTEQVFTFAHPGGAAIRLPGSPGYDPQLDTAMPCQIGLVTISLRIPDGTGNTTRVLTAQAAPRTALMGAAC